MDIAAALMMKSLTDSFISSLLICFLNLHVRGKGWSMVTRAKEGVVIPDDIIHVDIDGQVVVRNGLFRQLQPIGNSLDGWAWQSVGVVISHCYSLSSFLSMRCPRN